MPVHKTVPTRTGCRISAPVKRRSGKPRFWCSVHMAPAWDAMGRQAASCARSSSILPETSKILKLDPSRFPGGVGMWGCLAPAFNSSSLAPEQGIHVHARPSLRGDKAIDGTYPWVNLTLANQREILIDGQAARYATIASVLGIPIEYRECPNCKHPHLDEDWFAVNPHKKHQCMSCGRDFFAEVAGVSNPLAALPSMPRSGVRRAPRNFEADQREFAGGIQLWGSNQALLWTSTRSEDSGIHVHTYANPGDQYGSEIIDETYGLVTIDGIELDARQVQVFMAQLNLPHLAGRVASITCNQCGTAQFDDGVAAVQPTAKRACTRCNANIKTTSRTRNLVANPVIDKLKSLENLRSSPIRAASVVHM